MHMYLLLYCTPREYEKERNEVNMSKGRKGAPKSRGTSRNQSFWPNGKSLDPCRPRQGSAPRGQAVRRQKSQQTTTGTIASTLGATGSHGLSGGQAILTKKAILTSCGWSHEFGVVEVHQKQV
ncbi:hypothetical protein I79_017459 [Cricetulus griseus]|uniref:Uncharacterized protein n=1 Tax=Cricetulus griseus TaxID=10029 RepID=G3I240_CRIGR|nr:hypothetical protein I79_017459 [Cricetulus griseus]